MLLDIYYAKNYAGIIGLGLAETPSFNKNPPRNPLFLTLWLTYHDWYPIMLYLTYREGASNQFNSVRVFDNQSVRIWVRLDNRFVSIRVSQI